MAEQRLASFAYEQRRAAMFESRNVGAPGGHRGDAHIGEASHPGPLGNVFGPRLLGKAMGISSPTASAMATLLIVLSLCDGMSCGHMSLRRCDATFDRFIAVENDKWAQAVSKATSYKTSEHFPVPDHGWHNDIFNITEKDVIDLGPNNITLCLFGPPCGDFSKLRLLTAGGGDPRPGLRGENGKKFRQCITVLGWVLKHNPNCEFMCECVDFRDMKDDWDEICRALGKPEMVNSAVYSFTKRSRAYWHNLAYLSPGGLPTDWPLMDPDTCMMEGRTVQRYIAHGKQCVRPIGHSWKGDSDSPVANTQRPVLVDDVHAQGPQHLRPIEAEGLMGMDLNSTAAIGITAKQRLAVIGNGWDVNTTTLLLAHSRFVQHNATLLEEARANRLEMTTIAVVQQLLIHSHSELGSENLAVLIMQQPEHMQQYYLTLLADHATQYDTGSVLDSGSSKHLQRQTRVLDDGDRVPLTGFDGSMQWTKGNGYLPIAFTDDYTGGSIPMDVWDSDLMDDKLVTQILSLGKLLRSGWQFHLTGDAQDCYGLTPGGAHKVNVDLGMDDLLRIPHSVRSGTASAPMHSIPAAPVMALRRSADDATASFLHDVFLHMSMEKIYQTLGVTEGYKQTRFKDFHCESCARAKARDFGLKQGVQHSINPVNLNEELQDDVFGDNTDSDNGSDDESNQSGSHYLAPVAGRMMGVQNVPRFDIYKLRPFEVMFCDNKDFPCSVRGGAITAFIFIDYLSRAKCKVDLRSKQLNGLAFRRIIAKLGIHKLPYPCRIFTDGCGSMAHVELAASLMGIDHQYIPPHQQSLNEAEKVADTCWASARCLMDHSQAPDKLFAKCIDYVMYVDWRMATTAERSWLTPYQIAKGVTPSVARLHRFYTKCNVTVPRSKRKLMAKKGLHNYRAEPGRFIGFQSVFSSTYAVMLDGKTDRLVHSINVTFDDSNWSSVPAPPHPLVYQQFNFPLNTGHQGCQTKEAQVEEANVSESRDIEDTMQGNPLCDWPLARVQIEPMQAPDAFPEYFDPEVTDWRPNETSPQLRPRPSYVGHITNLIMFNNEAQADQFKDCLLDLQTHKPGYTDMANICYCLAVHSQKDMNWQRALQSEDAAEVILSLETEMASLLSTILTEIFPDDSEFEEALKLATPGRLILGTKRSGNYKSRGVKQGFKENKLLADGPGFNYYSHVAKLMSVRMVVFRPDRGTRRIAVKDVSVAFLQAHTYEEGTVKYICFKWPLTQRWRYFKQSGPIYGEASAVIRWENTIAPWLESEDFERGCNEPCAFHHQTRDLVDLLYVDDNLYDGEEDDIKWASDQLNGRFKCTSLGWLAQDSPMDHLGMWLTKCNEYHNISMHDYIMNALVTLGLEDCTPVDNPMIEPIDGTSAPLSAKDAQTFLTACGIGGWLQSTCRPDISYTQSRVAQHQAAPNESAFSAVKRMFRYLKGTSDLGLRSKNHPAERAVNLPVHHPDLNHGWEFFVDSDFAGNSETQNKRRSQNGFVAMLNGAPIAWFSKVSSVAFASPDIGESHADMSSGAAEVYAAGNASIEMMHISYVADELGIECPRPMYLQMDNTAAQAFAEKTAFKTKLKHIDTRQEWVRVLRDKELIQPVHVDSAFNYADLFTKILSTVVFTKMRDLMMHRIPSH